jgi:hypothetical protein
MDGHQRLLLPGNDTRLRDRLQETQLTLKELKYGWRYFLEQTKEADEIVRKTSPTFHPVGHFRSAVAAVGA